MLPHLPESAIFKKDMVFPFADLDNDGDEDIYIEMGGAFSGDAYENFFVPESRAE
jgi:hypothetical protein